MSAEADTERARREAQDDRERWSDEELEYFHHRFELYRTHNLPRIRNDAPGPCLCYKCTTFREAARRLRTGREERDISDIWHRRDLECPECGATPDYVDDGAASCPNGHWWAIKSDAAPDTEGREEQGRHDVTLVCLVCGASVRLPASDGAIDLSGLFEGWSFNPDEGWTCPYHGSWPNREEGFRPNAGTELDRGRPEEAGGEDTFDPRELSDGVLACKLKEYAQGSANPLIHEAADRIHEIVQGLRGAPEGAGERNPAPYYDFRRDNDYRIFAATNGVKVRAWDYEVPHTDEYGYETKVDPREVKPVGDVAQMIHLGLARVHSQMEENLRTRREERDGG